MISLRFQLTFLVLLLVAFGVIHSCSLVTPEVPHQKVLLGHSIQGQQIWMTIMGAGESVVLFKAGIHGSEPAGIPLLERLPSKLRREPDLLVGHTVLIISNINPDGVAAGTRYNARGIDLNRNFPASNWTADRASRGQKPLSEPESQIISDVIDRFRPEVIVTIHQPLACVDWDGPEFAEELAERISKSSQLPVCKLGVSPGSLGAFAGKDLGISVITVELPANVQRRNPRSLWSQYGDMLLVPMREPGPG